MIMKEELTNQEYNQVVNGLDYLNGLSCFRDMNNFMDNYRKALYLRGRGKYGK